MSARPCPSPAARERRRVVVPLALAAGLAWTLLALGAAGVAPGLAICSAALRWSLPSPEALGFVLAFVSPTGLALGWLAMVVAMMLPTACDPLVHVRERSLRGLRAACLALFLAGYLGVWSVAGAAVLGAAITVRVAFPDPVAPLVVAAATALVWQASPWKQAALNRCHRRPGLAPFAPAAWASAFAAGLGHGVACLASCWALMAAALLVPAHHLPVMALLAASVWAERLEPARPPRWRLRLPMRTLRMIARRVPAILPRRRFCYDRPAGEGRAPY